MADETADLTENNTAQDDLQASEIRYRRLFEATRDGVLILDAVSGKITDVNPYMMELLAFSREEFLGKELWQLGVFRDIEESKAAFRELQERGYTRYENMPLELKTGECREVEFVSNIYNERGRQVIQCNIRDNTEHKRVKVESEQTREWLSAIFEAAQDGIVVEENGRIVFVNNRLLRMYGYDSLDEVIGQSTLRLLKPEDAERMAEYGSRRARGEEAPTVYEFTVALKDGREITIEASISTFISDDKFYIVTVQRDITERKRMEDELRRSETNLANAQRIAHIGSWDSNIVTGQLFWSDEVYRIFGFSKGQFGATAEAFFDTIHPEDREMVKSAADAALYQGAPYNVEHRIIDQTGSEKVVCELGEVTFDESGKPLRMTGTVQDITERKRAEEALKASEALQRQLSERQTAIFNALPAHICLLCDLGNVLEINTAWRQFARMNRYGGDSFGIGSNYIEVCESATGDCSAEARQTAEGIRSVLSGKATHFELEYSCHSAEEERWFRLMVTPLDENASAGAVVMHMNVTERKQAEETLRASEDRYRLLFESNPLPVFVYDIETLRFLAVNDASMLHYGYSHEEFLSMTLLDIHLQEDVPALMNNVSNISGGIDKAGEWKHRKKDGSIIDVEIISHDLIFAGRPAELVLANDLTKRKLAEDALRQAESKYRTIVESLPAIVYITQPFPPYAPIYVSPNITEFGYTEAEWFSRVDMWTSVLHKEDRERVLSATEAAMSEGLGTELEYRIMGRDGSIHWVHDKGRFISDEWGNRTSWQGVMLDITKTKELEEQLLQSQKLESVGRLAGGIAHDFNNMLTAVNGYSELTLRRLSAADPLRQNLEEIKKAGQRAAALTHQLLAFSRQQMLQPVVLDLDEVISDIIKMLQRLIGEDVQLVTALNPKAGRVKVDPGQLSQIIVNLAVNARDAMPEGGKMTIETSNVFLDPDYAKQHVGVLPGAYVMLAVSDTGTGMSAVTQRHIFEPFFTTKEVGKGTGLGLATVYGIVKQSGGNISVYSEEGVGTTFKIYLPRVAEAVQDAALEDSSDELPGGTETILLVEDEEMVRTLTRQILEECGYTVLEAQNGVEAVSMCETHDCRIDLLLTDVVMPQMGGRELAGRFARIYPHMQILFTSGYTDDAVVRHGVLSAGTNFIQKPFTPYGLARRIREILDAPRGS